MPNKGMFPKDRPSGLEFPSCEKCNQGSKWFEDIVAFVASIQLVFEDEVWAKEHFDKKLAHIANTHPEVLKELELSFSQKKRLRKQKEEGLPVGTGLNLRGHTVSLALNLYGAKLGLALHWAETRQVLPANGLVAVSGYSNERQYDGGVPQHLFELLPEPRTLQQGQKVSQYPFSYASGKAIDADPTGHWACFSDSIMYHLFVGTNLNFSTVPPENLFAPGCLTTPKPASRTIPIPSWVSPDNLL